MINLQRDTRPGRQAAIGFLAAIAALVVAIGTAVLTGTDSGIGQSVEVMSAASGNVLSDVAAMLPLGYAFGAGMVATVNPCGFALLPAYLGRYLGDSANNHASVQPGLRRALIVSGSVTAGFVVLFGLAGLALAVATTVVVHSMPWLGLLIGVLLIIEGGRALNGARIATNLGNRFAARWGSRAHQRNYQGYFAYGLAYGAASLSCTLPIFLAVVGSTLVIDSLAARVGQFLLYALGMGFVISLLTLGTSVFKRAVIRKVRLFHRYVQPVSAVLLLLAGAYIVYYWLTVGGLLATLQ